MRDRDGADLLAVLTSSTSNYQLGLLHYVARKEKKIDEKMKERYQSTYVFLSFFPSSSPSRLKQIQHEPFPSS